MSFSMRVKSALCDVKTSRECCKKAELYAMMLYSGVLDGLLFKTRQEPVARRLADGLAKELGQVADFRIYSKNGETRYGVILPCPFEPKLKGPARDSLLTLLRDELLQRGKVFCKQCPSAFLRGAFLVCGGIADPEKDYLIEFGSSCDVIKHCLTERDIQFRLQERDRRSSARTIAVQESESVENLLAVMGASLASMEVMELRIEREVRNKANRIVNMDSANISRQVSAAARQCAAIRRLDLDKLDPDLRAVAELRLENPDMSLSELGENLRPPLSRSAVDRRLRKLTEMGVRNDSV